MSDDTQDAWVNEVRLWFYGGTPPRDEAGEDEALGMEAATGALVPPLLTVTPPLRRPVPRLPHKG
jgi:hypothetical protein